MWRPIKSAPRDGTKIILAKIFPATDVRKAEVWWACMGFWLVRRANPGMLGEGTDYVAAWTDGVDTLGNPTHWMPVPAFKLEGKND